MFAPLETLAHDAEGDVIQYAIQAEARWPDRAEYALRLLFEGIGLSSCRTELTSNADVVYSRERPAALADHAVWVPMADVADWDSPATWIPRPGEIPTLGPNQWPESFRTDRACAGADIVYSTYAIVTGALERDMPRDLVGVPITRSRGSRLHELFDRPLVGLYCRHLASTLAERKQTDIVGLPRWPNGKKYAVVLTHDVDAPFTRPAWSFYRRRLVNQISQGAFPAAGRGLLQGAKTATSTRFARLPSPAEDPNFCFEEWREIENSLECRSCFYVAVTNSADRLGSVVDVKYDYRHPEIVNQLVQAAEQGWEIGLHASANAYRIPGRVQQEREMLEAVLEGHRVGGVRHHYWALDPELPERTFWLHAAADLTYDSSLGFNDTPGFRRGMAWPFQPFDREQSQRVPLLEVPPTLMDGSIFYRRPSSGDGHRRIQAHLNEVKSVGGAAVLDWHQEQLNPARLNGAGAVLVSVLRQLAADSDVWWATPDQVASWWQQRQARLADSTGTVHP